MPIDLPDFKVLFRDVGPVPAPAPPEHIAHFEAEFGVRFPATYARILRQRNGGALRLNGLYSSAPYPDWAEHPHLYKVNYISAIHPEHVGPLDDCARRLRRRKVPTPPGLIGYDNRGRGHWLTLDYRLRGPHAEPAFTHIGPKPGQEFVVAESFDDMLGRLEIVNEYFVFALDAMEAGTMTGGHLRDALVALGCREGKPGPWSWHGPAAKPSRASKATIFRSENGIRDAAHLSRGARHPLLLVEVSEKFEDEVLGGLIAALAGRAELIYQPPHRRKVR